MAYAKIINSRLERTIMKTDRKRTKLAIRALFLAVAAIAIAISAWSLRSKADQSAGLKVTIAEIEKDLKLPGGSYPLSSYDRFYAKNATHDGIIHGVFRHRVDLQGSIQIVPPSSLPVIFDGGCSVIRLRYSLVTHQVDYITCNGDA